MHFYITKDDNLKAGIKKRKHDNTVRIERYSNASLKSILGNYLFSEATVLRGGLI